MLNTLQKNKLFPHSLPTTQHLASLKQSVLASYLLVQQKKLRNLVKLEKQAELAKIDRKLKQKLLKTVVLKSLKLMINSKLFKKTRQRFSFKKSVKKFVRPIRKKSRRFFRKAFISKRFNKSKFRLPKNCPGLFKYRLAISIKKNNVFCTFSGIQDNNKTLVSCNSGSYKIKVTKKTLRYTYDSVLKIFYNRVKRIYPMRKKVSKEEAAVSERLKIVPGIGLIATIVIPKRLRKKVVKSIRSNFDKIPLLIKAVDKKVFNGCRAPKSIRKKRRRRLRLYK